MGEILLDPRLLDMGKDVAIGTLAHEFAHLFLAHTGAGSLQGECEASELACQWGFPDDVRVVCQHFGPPTEKRKQI